jgi:hypothetical protein
MARDAIRVGCNIILRISLNSINRSVFCNADEVCFLRSRIFSINFIKVIVKKIN